MEDREGERQVSEAERRLGEGESARERERDVWGKGGVGHCHQAPPLDKAS